MVEVHISVRELIIRSGHLSRRRLRTTRCYFYARDGRKFGMDDTVRVGSEPVEGVFRDINLRFCAMPPPVLAMNKPRGIVTSRVREYEALCVFDLLAGDPLAASVEPVGRLDKDTEGLLLFTSDGRLHQRLTHPKREVPRTYVATLSRALDADALEALRAGRVVLRDGSVIRPRRVEVYGRASVAGGAAADGALVDGALVDGALVDGALVDGALVDGALVDGALVDGALADGAQRVEIELVSGKYHEVRRAFAAAGSHVDALMRTRYGSVTLASCGLAPGAARVLDDDAYAALYASVQLTPPEPTVVFLPGASGCASG